MNGHLDTWIDAYLDGELSGAHKQQADAHLAKCQPCRDLLEERRALSSLLQTVPPADISKSERQFAAEVGLQLTRRQDAAPQRRQAWNLAWQLIPVSLILALIFIQTVAIVSVVLEVTPGAGQALSQPVLTQGEFSFLPHAAELPQPVTNLIGWLGFFSLPGWSILTGLIAIILIGLLYIAWLASWWSRSQHGLRTEN